MPELCLLYLASSFFLFKNLEIKVGTQVLSLSLASACSLSPKKLFSSGTKVPT